MDIENEPVICNKKDKCARKSMIIPKKRCKYMKDIGYSDTIKMESDPPEVPNSDTDTADSPAGIVLDSMEVQNSTQELLTSDNQTTNSPQDSEELVFQSETESSNRDETDQLGSSSGDSITEKSVPELFDHSTVPDGKRTRRTSRRIKDIDECCPVCGITVRIPELGNHLAQEIEKLSNISRTKKIRIPSLNEDGINTSFVQVKSNRENRLSAKIAHYASKSQEIQCPICKVRLTGTYEEISNHCNLCAQTENDVIVDEDDDSSSEFEEYQIGDQTRIRVISLVPGGYRSLQGQTVVLTQEDIDVDVEVDVDDTVAYGQPQYTELDVISNRTEDMDETDEQLRKSVLVDPTAQPKVLESRKWGDNSDEGESTSTELRENQLISKQNENNKSATEDQKNQSTDQMVSSLKAKIKELEDQNKNHVKCLICLEPYTKPVVATTCWHVHCEECWLMTMGVKKLCPQCNMIVFPTDLRKIYL